MIYQFTQNGLPPDCHAELQTVMLNVVKHLLQMTCSVNMYIITFSFFTAYATFDLNSPKVYAESFKMNCAPKVGHNIEYYER